MPTALVFDPIRTTPWSYAPERELLAARGVELVVPSDRATTEQMASADVLVVSARLPSDRLAELDACCAIVCYSVGMDGVDAPAAAARGIRVTNVPGYCTEEVADHAIGLLFALERAIVRSAEASRAGRWAIHREAAFQGIRRLSTLTVGIVGVGRIGSRVAGQLAALGIRTLLHDPYRPASADVPGAWMDLASLFDDSDAVILCAAAGRGDAPLIDASALARFRPEAVLINVARGSLVDEAALATALRDGRLRGAALDVRATEPPPEDDPLRELPGVILTQHLAARSIEAHADLHRLAAERVLEVLEDAGRLPAPGARV
jgi:D-3-phosphoglycerate dehydrogenase